VNSSAFTFLELAADWHGLVLPWHIMRPSIAHNSRQLDSRYTSTPISHTRPSSHSLYATTH